MSVCKWEDNTTGSGFVASAEAPNAKDNHTSNWEAPSLIQVPHVIKSN